MLPEIRFSFTSPSTLARITPLTVPWISPVTTPSTNTRPEASRFRRMGLGMAKEVASTAASSVAG